MQKAGLPRASRFKRSALICIATSVFLSAPVRAQAPAAVDDMPIADAHFHFMPYMTADELLARMDKHKIRWTVSHTAIGNEKMSPWEIDTAVKQKLGPRYHPSTGGREFFVGEKMSGTAFYTEAEHPGRRKAFASMETLLKPGGVTISETFPNAETSSFDPLRRRRVPTDSPYFIDLMEMAGRNNVSVPMHMEWHPESVAGLARLLDRFPQGVVVLSHCGKTATAEGMRPMLAKYPNLYCDLSHRGLPQERSGSRDSDRVIYWPASTFSKAGMKPDWRQLIEDFPDRFMLGIDDTHNWGQYDDIVAAIRTGVLAQLTPATAEKVAWRNAVKIFKLTDGN